MLPVVAMPLSPTRSCDVSKEGQCFNCDSVNGHNTVQFSLVRPHGHHGLLLGHEFRSKWLLWIFQKYSAWLMASMYLYQSPPRVLGDSSRRPLTPLIMLHHVKPPALNQIYSHTHCGNKEDFQLHTLANIYTCIQPSTFIVFRNTRYGQFLWKKCCQCPNTKRGPWTSVYLHTNTQHSLLRYPSIKINPLAELLQQQTGTSFIPLPFPKAYPDRT